MADGTQPFPPLSAGAVDGGAIVVSLDGERYALPSGSVEAILPPPALSRVPHAPPLLLGAGNLGGQVLPIVDLAAMLPGRRPSRRYDGGGEVLRLRASGGSVGLWVDRVERLMGSGGSTGLGSAIAIDPEKLIATGLAAPELAADNRYPLGDAREIVDRPPAAVSDAGYILVAAAGQNVLLARQTVLELTDTPPNVPFPGAPDGFYGIGVLRGEALPLLSLTSLLALGDGKAPAYCAVMTLAGNRLLLGFDRVVGLRSPEYLRRHRRDHRVFNPATAIPEGLREVVSGFAVPRGSVEQSAADRQGGLRQYLSFVVGKQSYALPVEAVDRVVPSQPLVALPRMDSGQKGVTGAIELRGQVVPVAAIEPSAGEAGAYVIMRGNAGPMAIGAERIDRLVALRPEQIAPTRGDEALIDGVGVLGEDRNVLRILAPERIGGGA